MKLLLIDNELSILKFLITEFNKRVNIDLNIIALLFQNNNYDPAKQKINFLDEIENTSASTASIYEVNGEEALLSDEVIKFIQKELTTIPGDKRALIDIFLVNHVLGDKKFNDFESVRFARKLLGEEIVLLREIFFYSYTRKLYTFKAEFRENTSETFNEPLPRPAPTSGMDNKSELDRFVERAFRKIKKEDEYAE
jgi:hypothetical protein